MPECPLMPKTGVHVINPRLLLLPEIDAPMQMACVYVGVRYCVLYPEVRRIPRPFLRMRANPDWLQSIRTIGARLAVRPAPEPAARGSHAARRVDRRTAILNERSRDALEGKIGSTYVLPDLSRFRAK